MMDPNEESQNDSTQMNNQVENGQENAANQGDKAAGISPLLPGMSIFLDTLAKP